LPVVEQSAGELLSLPMFPHLTDWRVDLVCESLHEALRSATVNPELADAR
jgi:dTDP-4-amino-4,6-dideoxygalactose transaminase